MGIGHRRVLLLSLYHGALCVSDKNAWSCFEIILKPYSLGRVLGIIVHVYLLLLLLLLCIHIYFFFFYQDFRSFFTHARGLITTQEIVYKSSGCVSTHSYL